MMKRLVALILLWLLSLCAHADFVSASSAAGNTSALEVTAPSGVAENDILIMFGTQGGAGNATFTWPSGFTELASANSATATNTNRVAYKIATSSEPATYTLTTSVGDLIVTGIAAWRGRNTGATLSAQTTLVETPAEAPFSVDLTGVTAAAGDDIVWIAMRVPTGGGSLTTPLWTPPTNYTERIDQNATSYISASLATRDNVSAGATGTLSGQIGASDDAGYAGFVVALPASGGSGGGLVVNPISGRGGAAAQPVIH